VPNVLGASELQEGKDRGRGAPVPSFVEGAGRSMDSGSIVL
jgi:hypothetical protein